MKHSKVYITSFALLVSNFLLAAPAPPPAGTTGGPVCWPPPCVPVDNGVIFLVAAGLLYGAKKLYDLRKKSQVIS